MPDIFLSYNREDQVVARRFADAFKAQGFEVWWDSALRAGETYDQVTEKALREAKAVVVLWSKKSVNSDWVRAEASIGQEHKHLAPVKIESCDLPVMFRLVQTAELSHWNGDAKDPAWLAFVSDVRKFVEQDAPSPSPQTRLTTPAPPNRRTLLRRPIVLGGLAAALLALVAVAAMFMMRPQSNQATAAPTSQRVAFFGFTTASDDPAAKAMAEAATDQMFQTMGLIHLDTVARTETLGTPADKRFIRAGELQALYMLSGEVRPENGSMSFSIRFEDVPSRTTLWDQNVGRPASEVTALPIQAAYRTTDTVRCIIQRRVELTRNTTQLLKLVADACRTGSYNRDKTDAYVIGRRALAVTDPNSAFFQAALALALISGLPNASDAARPARIAEAEALLNRAAQLDPKKPVLASARFRLARAKGASLAEQEANLLKAIADLEGKDPFLYSDANASYASLTRDVGRLQDSQVYRATAVENDPLSPRRDLGYTLAINGQVSKAQVEFEQDFAHDPTSAGWEMWISSAVFLGVGDAEAMLKSPPSTIPKSSVDCWRDIRRIYASKDRKVRALGAERVSRCETSGDLGLSAAIGSLAALGDIEAAYGLASKHMVNSTGSNLALEPIFWPTSSAMRADARFLPLVEKLGLMDYWTASGHRPDFCSSEDVPTCRKLKPPTAKQ